ncbi:MAG: hypothetical protein J5I90_22305 [Caldilineales bacterium]|nr:hypothetical protein [Caldilineales bacterium]
MKDSVYRLLSGIAVFTIVFALMAGSQLRADDSTIVIAGTSADERDVSFAWDSVAGEWLIGYEIPNNVMVQKMSGDGTLVGAPTPIDNEGGVDTPVAYLLENGRAGMAFFDLRFDPLPSITQVFAPLQDDDDEDDHPPDCDCGDCSATFPGATSQIPLANGPGQQYPQTAFTGNFLYLQRQDGSPRQLLNLNLSNFQRIPISDGTAEVTQAVAIDNSTGGGTIAVAEEGILKISIVMTNSVTISNTQVISATDVDGLALTNNSDSTTILYRTGDDETAEIGYVNLDSTSLQLLSQPQTLETSNEPDDPATACLPDGRCLIVWEEKTVEDITDIWVAFSQNGRIGPGFQLTSEGGNEHAFVAANPDNENFLVGWDHQNQNDRDVQAQIVPAQALLNQSVYLPIIFK